MNIVAERAAGGLRPATPVDSPLVFLSDRWFVHPANNISAPFGQQGERASERERRSGGSEAKREKGTGRARW